MTVTVWGSSPHYENKKLFQRIYNKIKEEGIEETYDIVLRKTETLKKVFIKFLNTIKVVTTGLLDIIAYTFLIPIITDIQSMVSFDTNIKEISITIAKRLLASGVVLVGSETLISILRKIIKRFK
jgi:3-methyladenine DNA glycosylase Tag